MSTDTCESPKVKEKRTNPNASSRLVRPDYHKKPILSYAEASLYSGLGVKQIMNLTSSGKLRLAAKRGAFRIFREDLDEYLGRKPC
jgi:excisionase family DNA binding protein